MSKYEVFVSSKTSVSVKGGYNYYITTTNWEKNSDLEIKLHLNKDLWNKIVENKKAEIKIKRGLLDSVIWGIKQ